ncbi:hypothetical protein TIFTF001_055115 [Ficus carica]|uniref:Uncharacterized protein n=1 Tax=Ficus carica TaxID=3494 RepID=A0AA88EA93_FICCA|nr:hypothetical protein TIFTF001_055115 [Ficus carica]
MLSLSMYDMVSGLDHGLSWKWTGRPNHSMAACHGKQPVSNL